MCKLYFYSVLFNAEPQRDYNFLYYYIPLKTSFILYERTVLFKIIITRRTNIMLENNKLATANEKEKITEAFEYLYDYTNRALRVYRSYSNKYNGKALSYDYIQIANYNLYIMQLYLNDNRKLRLNGKIIKINNLINETEVIIMTAINRFEHVKFYDACFSLGYDALYDYYAYNKRNFEREDIIENWLIIRKYIMMSQ